jgi:hypothetical protein
MKKLAKVTALTLIVAASTAAATSAYAERDRFEGKPHCERFDHNGFPGKMEKREERKLNLNEEQAKILVQARLIMRGNERLKAGKVTKKDDNTYIVQVVTVDDSLVREVEVDRQHGLPRPPMRRM